MRVATPLTATQAAREFARMLDEVEHHGASFTIARNGRVVAEVRPVAPANGGRLNILLGAHARDLDWGDDLAAVRDLLMTKDVEWRD